MGTNSKFCLLLVAVVGSFVSACAAICAHARLDARLLFVALHVLVARELLFVATVVLVLQTWSQDVLKISQLANAGLFPVMLMNVCCPL